MRLRLVLFTAAISGGLFTHLLSLFAPDHGDAYHWGGITGMVVSFIVILIIERKSRASDGRAGSGNGRRDPDSNQ